MNTRLIILLYSVPLFMVLAGLNGALLYSQEKSEFASTLNNQALSAAVTAAEFASSMANPESALAQPSRHRSIMAAAQSIKNLDGFYFISDGENVTELSPAASPWLLENLSPPQSPVAYFAPDERSGRSYVIATAPVSETSFVAARLDAASMTTRLAELRQNIVLIIAVAGVIGAILAWYVAHRIIGDLEKNREAIVGLESGKASGSDQTVSIREARDLADAVRLMDASRRAFTKRLSIETARRDKERSATAALSRYSRSVFGPASTHAAGADIAIRILGEARAGYFFALCSTDGRGSTNGRAMIVAGECAADAPADAFVRARGARRFLEANLLRGDDANTLRVAKSAYNIKTLEHIEWSAGASPLQGLCILAFTDDSARRKAEHHASVAAETAPDDFLDTLDALLKPTGIFAAVRMSGLEGGKTKTTAEEGA